MLAALCYCVMSVCAVDGGWASWSNAIELKQYLFLLLTTRFPICIFEHLIFLVWLHALSHKILEGVFAVIPTPLPLTTMPVKFFALRAVLNMTLLILYSSISEPLNFMSQDVKDVTPELFDTVGVHGQHVSVLEHFPECAYVGGVAPKDYPL